MPYPFDEVAGQRFRCEHFYSILQNSGYDIELKTFYDADMLRIMYKPGNTFKKGLKLATGFIRRLFHVFSSRQYDFVYIYRELTPIGPPFLEWFIAVIMRKPIVFDFDDAIWLPDENESGLKAIIKCKWKIKRIIKWSSVVSCGNAYLVRYASQFNGDVRLVPTVVDTVSSHFPREVKSFGLPVIGWTGSHSTLIYLDQVYPILEELQKTAAFTFRVICNKKPEVNYPWLEYVEWSKETEIEDLSAIDIGIMPLPESRWSEGKCGFKIIQYLALEIPAVASPVGINKEIIINGVNGYLCSAEEEWIGRLTELLRFSEKRKTMGIEGRKLIIDSYSVEYASPLFLALFD